MCSGDWSVASQERHQITVQGGSGHIRAMAVLIPTWPIWIVGVNVILVESSR